MNIKEAKNEIINTVQAYLSKDETGEYKIPSIRQRPILLMGPPGIGKTQIMEQVARECKIGLVAYTITHHTRQSAVGLPYIKEENFEGKIYSVTEYTMSEIIASVYSKMKESKVKEGILFIDEINCVSETLAPTMLQFLQCKTFGNEMIPKGWIIVAAGNPPEYNKSVRDFDMVTLDRVRRIDVDADYNVWKEYAVSNNINNAILSYLDIRPANFYRIEADVDGIEYVTARGWEDLSNLLDVYEELGIKITEEIIYEFLSFKDVAMDVAAYIDLYNKYKDDYAIDDILKGNVKPKIYERLLKAPFDEKITVVNLLGDGLKKHFDRIYHTKFITDKWFAFLKSYKRELEFSHDGTVLYKKMFDNMKEEYEINVRSGFISKGEAKDMKILMDKINDNIPCEQTDDLCFEHAAKDFKQMTDCLCEYEQAGVDALENAFDFMESAFENTQEMVVFVTELTINPMAAVFIKEQGCKRYEEYSTRLLIGSARADILALMER